MPSGIIPPAPESAHAIRGAIDEALRCRESREAKTILFGLTGTGYFDMTAYENYLNGKMSDSIPTDADLQKGFDSPAKNPPERGYLRLHSKTLGCTLSPGWL